MFVDPNTRINEKKKEEPKSQELAIWQVARTATAAGFYCVLLKVEQGRASGQIFSTGRSFSHTSNPTHQGKREIEDLHGHNSLGYRCGQEETAL